MHVCVIVVMHILWQTLNGLDSCVIRNIHINIMGRDISLTSQTSMGVASCCGMVVVHTLRQAPPPIARGDHVDHAPTIYCPLTCRYNVRDRSVITGDCHVDDRHESLIHIHTCGEAVFLKHN